MLGVALLVITRIVTLIDRVRYFWGSVSNFNQSEVRKHSFLASDWLTFDTLPQKYRAPLVHVRCIKRYFFIFR